MFVINTHFHNSNLIWRTVSRRVDEVIPLDHQRGSNIFQGGGPTFSGGVGGGGWGGSNLSSLIRLSVSDGQKTDSSKVVSAIGI